MDSYEFPKDNTNNLFATIKHKKTAFALTVIEQGGIDYTRLNERNDTVLMAACRYNLVDVALKIIETMPNKQDIGFANPYGQTALLWTCTSTYKSKKLILALIESGNSNPSQLARRNSTHSSN
jgi:ankyrin repeat protein